MSTHVLCDDYEHQICKNHCCCCFQACSALTATNINCVLDSSLAFWALQLSCSLYCWHFCLFIYLLEAFFVLFSPLFFVSALMFMLFSSLIHASTEWMKYRAVQSSGRKFNICFVLFRKQYKNEIISIIFVAFDTRLVRSVVWFTTVRRSVVIQ